jgi:hypothetical protein
MIVVKQIELGFKDYKVMGFKRFIDKTINIGTLVTSLPWSDFKALPLFYREYKDAI